MGTLPILPALPARPVLPGLSAQATPPTPPPIAPQLDLPAGVVDDLAREPWVRQRLVHDILVPASAAQLRPWPDLIHPALLDALSRRGMASAYSHQAQAVRLALEGRDVVVVTPTASGKSLCYTVPVLDAWLRDPEARSLWLFPTKALAQDQLASLQELGATLPPGLRASTYDGDTPSGLRRAVRQSGHIVVTNPDMLHSGVLPHHTGWVRLFQNLRFIVIDELHTYRGVFGSHLANVLRRLLRLCRFYGSSPTLIACSATIANPAELATRLWARPVCCVDQNGAPRAPRRLWFWNPPRLSGGPHDRLGVRRSAVLEARRLMAELLRRRLQAIAFCRSRAGVEVLLTYLRRLEQRAPGAPPLVRGYRGGYLPLERRAIEQGLRDGTVRGVVSTNALELGVDIGGLDAAVLLGYPGSIASTWQQLGRAGRRETTSLGVFIATDSPLDQFLVRTPRFLLDTPPEQALVDPDNLLVLGAHLQAAAFEVAFDKDEGFGTADVGALLECFTEDGLLHRSGGRYHWSSDAFPAEAISLRRACATNVLIIDTSTSPDGPGQGPQGARAGSAGGRAGSHGRVIGEVDQFAAPVLVHDDAIYLHEGAQFHVERLDWEEKRAYVHPVEVDHYTVAETRSSVSVLERYQGPVGLAVQHSLGEVRLTRLATIYKKVKLLTHENVGAGPITVPEQDLHTVAWWMAFSEPATAGINRAVLETGLHGLAAAAHAAAALLCMCDPRDLGVHAQLRSSPQPGAVHAPPPPLTGRAVDEPSEYAAGWRPAPAGHPEVALAGWPTVYLYDVNAGGIGLAERCFERHQPLLDAARSLVAGCDCGPGCPSCVGPSPEGVDGRAATLQLLSRSGAGR